MSDRAFQRLVGSVKYATGIAISGQDQDSQASSLCQVKSQEALYLEM